MKRFIFIMVSIVLCFCMASCDSIKFVPVESSPTGEHSSNVLNDSGPESHVESDTGTSSEAEETVEKLVYESDDLSITFLGFEKPPYPALGYYINLHIENKSDADYTIQERDLSVDGIMLPFGNVIFSCSVMAKKKANDHIWVTGLEENGISEPITSAEFKFAFIKNKDYENTELSDIISVEDGL